MPSVPLAAFLTGALLTILMPLALLIALSVWYWLFSVRVPGTEARPRAGAASAATTPGAANPGPAITENLPPDPAH